MYINHFSHINDRMSEVEYTVNEDPYTSHKTEEENSVNDVI